MLKYFYIFLQIRTKPIHHYLFVVLFCYDKDTSLIFLKKMMIRTNNDNAYFAFLHNTLNGIEKALLYFDFKRRISLEADALVK